MRVRAGPLLLFVTCVWGSTFVVTKDVVASAPPFLYLTLRFALGSLLLLPLYFARKTPRSAQFWSDAIVLALLAAAGLCFQVVGQAYTTASKSAFVTSLNTPLTPAVGFLLYRTVPTRAQRLGVGLATLGLLLLTWPHGAGRVNPGDLLTVCAATVFAFFIVEAARRMPRHDAVGLSVVLASGGAIFYALVCGSVHLLGAYGLAPAELVRLELRPFPRSLHIGGEVLYMAVVCVSFITLAQTWAMQRLSAATAAVIFALEPVAATTLAVMVDGPSEWPGPRGVAGAFCVLCAVLVAEGRSLRRQTRAATSRSGANS